MAEQYHSDRDMAVRIAKRVAELGGTVYLVGGCVRDEVIGRTGKDVDIEVHGVTPLVLEKVLDDLGERMAIGESFGLYALKGYTIDIAMPRKEKATGHGHRDFDVLIDPFLGAKEAARRRDFTVNAMMKDLLTGEILDFYGGREDLKKGILRHVDDNTFAEDPLRVLRGAQFAARLNLTVAPETLRLCRTVDLSALSRERVDEELKKALLKADNPSVFFETLREMKALTVWFPEVEALIGVKQDPIHHPEGDVWIHTMRTLDVAATMRDRVTFPYGFMLAALTHDFGKAICTQVVKGRIHAYEHETKGQSLVRAFLCRLTDEAKRIRYVEELTTLHMQPNLLASVRPAVRSTNRMFDRTKTPEDLLCLAAADYESIPGQPTYDEKAAFLQERLSLYKQIMARPFVQGRDLIAVGLTPDERFSDLLSYAHKLRLADIEKSSALKQTLAYARTLERKNEEN